MLSKTGNHENAAACLGDSEITRVQHPEESHIPAVGKGPDDFLNVLAIVAIEQPVDVFKYHPRGPNFLEETYDLIEESASLAPEAEVAPAPSCAHLADVLAWKPGSNAINITQHFSGDVADVFMTPCGGEVLGKHGARHGVNFNLPFCFPARALESEIEPADSGEEASNGGFVFRVPFQYSFPIQSFPDHAECFGVEGCFSGGGGGFEFLQPGLVAFADLVGALFLEE